MRSPSNHVRALARTGTWWRSSAFPYGLALVVLALVLGGHPCPLAAEPGTRPIPVGVFIVPAHKVKMSRAREATVLLTMETTLQRDRRLDVMDKDVLLARRAGIVPVKDIAQGRAMLRKGRAALARGKGADAVAPLEQAAKILASTLAFSSKRDLASAQYLLGAALVAAGDSKKAERAFMDLLTWRATFADGKPPMALPAQAAQVFRAAKDKVDRRKRGALELVTEPAGALAYIDGRFLGFTPTSAAELVNGDHYLTLKLNGYTRQVITAEVTRRDTKRLEAKLVESPGIAEMTELAKAVARDLEREEVDGAVKLGQLLSVDHAVFVEVPTAGANNAAYRAAVFDTRTGKRLRIVTARTTQNTSLEEVLGQLATSLYENLELDSPGNPPAASTSGPAAEADLRDHGQKVLLSATSRR